MFIMLSIYILITIATVLITICGCVDVVDSLENISNNIEQRFNAIAPFDIADITLSDDLRITLSNINISIIYLDRKEVNDFTTTITYYNFYVNFVYDVTFKQLADNLKGALINEVVFTKDKCSAFIYFPLFIIKRHLTDEMSLEIDERYAHQTTLVQSDMNEYYLFYDTFIKDEMKLNVVKDALYDTYLQKFRNVLLFYPRCMFLVMFDKMNEVLRKEVVVGYKLADCDEFKEIKIKNVKYETIIKRGGVALNITKVNYDVNYKTHIQERESFTYFTFIEIGYGRHLQFGEVYPQRGDTECINDAMKLLILKAFEKVYNS